MNYHHPPPGSYSNIPQRRGPPMGPPPGHRNIPPHQQIAVHPHMPRVHPHIPRVHPQMQQPVRRLQPNTVVQSSSVARSRSSSQVSSSSRNPKVARDTRIRKSSKTKRKIRHKRQFPTGLNAKTAFFIKQLRFAPPKPKIITGPKFYNPVVPSEILYKYRPNTFGSGHHMRLHTSSHLGLPIPLVVPPKKLKKPEKKMDHQDLILLGEKKSKKGKKLYKTQFSWLRKTEYISSNKPGMGGPGGKGHGGGHGLLLPGDDLGGMMDKQREGWFDVDKSFKDIKKDYSTMKHPTKKGVTMIDSYDVFPDFSRWQNDFVNVHFDADFQPKGGMLVRQTGMKKELNFYENLSRKADVDDKEDEMNRLLTNQPTGHIKEGEKYGFKKNFSIAQYPNENMFSITFDEEKKQGLINPLSQFYVLKKNPYKTKNNPPLITKYRDKRKLEENFLRKKMKQIGMEIE